MFLDPSEMASNYFEHLRSSQIQDAYIESQIDEHKAVAVKRLYKVVDPFYAEAIAATIANAYENELPEATEIIKRLGLNDKHIAALNNDTERMCELILKEMNE